LYLPVVTCVVNLSRDRVLTVLRAIVHEVRTENLTFMAGSIAYHAFLSLLPLLVLVLAALSALGDRTLVEAFLRLMESVLSVGAGDAVFDELASARGSLSASIVGGAVLVWGTLRIFRGLDQAFSDIYESEAANTFVDQLGDGVVVLGTFAVAILGGVVVNSVFPATGDPLLSLVRRLLFVGGLALTFFPMYYIFPDADVTVWEVVPGVLVAAVGLTLFESLFQFYLQFRDPTGGSVVTGVVLLLTWLYFSGLVILLGAAVNAVLGNRSADVDIEPVFGGVAPSDKAAREERLVDSLRLVEERLDGRADLRLRVGGDEVVLEPPSRVAVDVSGEGDVPEEVTLVVGWRTSVRDEADRPT
jgi:membrane protein